MIFKSSNTLPLGKRCGCVNLNLHTSSVMAKNQTKRDCTPDGCKFSCREMITEIDRELSQRKYVYKRLISEGKLTKDKANKQYGRLFAAKKALIKLIDILHPEQPKIPHL